MKKSDLKIGYVVESREGNLYMVMPSLKADFIFARLGGFRFHYNYREDLKSNFGLKYDIVAVYGLSSMDTQTLDLSTTNRELLWKREEEKKQLTVAEIEELLGYGVEIVSDNTKLML